ncbi:MAG TPA: hypothetical protein VL727_14890 [Puia sp.]|jgi:hypothetical protein|nr:hypothetical protein [Puia sp.]
MRQLLFSFFFIFLLSCNNRSSTGKDGRNDTIGKIIKDTPLKASVDTSRNTDSAEPVVFKERIHLDRQEYSIRVIQQSDNFNDLLVVYNKVTKKSDTLDVSGQYSGEENEIHVLDATDSLQIKPLLLEIISPTGSDWYNHSFVGYDSGKLKQLFEIDDFPDAKRLDLHRKGKWALTGFISERDELVYEFEQYQVDVSLRDYSVNFPKPAKLYIGYETEATEGFQARRVINNHFTDPVYTVKKGTPLKVDTLYNDQNKVRLIIKDSIILEINTDNIKGKIRGNAAG